MEYALKLSNVCKEYDSSEFALDNVGFAIFVLLGQKTFSADNGLV